MQELHWLRKHAILWSTCKVDYRDLEDKAENSKRVGISPYSFLLGEKSCSDGENVLEGGAAGDAGGSGSPRLGAGRQKLFWCPFWSARDKIYKRKNVFCVDMLNAEAAAFRRRGF